MVRGPRAYHGASLWADQVRRRIAQIFSCVGGANLSANDGSGSTCAFLLRELRKVAAQWLLVCSTHNVLKIWRVQWRLCGFRATGARRGRRRAQVTSLPAPDTPQRNNSSEYSDRTLVALRQELQQRQEAHRQEVHVAHENLAAQVAGAKTLVTTVRNLAIGGIGLSLITLALLGWAVVMLVRG